MKRQIAALLTATVIPLAACTATSGADPAMSSGPVSSSVTTTSQTSTVPMETEPIDSGQSGTETVSAPPVDTSPASTSTTSASTTETGDLYDAIPVEIASAITGADLDAAEQGVAVWRNAVRVLDQSLQDPAGKDWKPIIYRYINDPAALKQMALINTFVKQGIHQVGDTGYTARVLEADEQSVKIRACLDLGKTDVVDAAGHSVVQSDGLRHIRRDYLLGYYEGSDDLYVGLIDIPDPAQSC